MNELHSIAYSGAPVFDPVATGVAQGLSQLFPPVEHPSGYVAGQAAPQDCEGGDAES